MFLGKFNEIVGAMPKPADSYAQKEIALVLENLEVVRKHMDACDKQRAILDATLANLKKDWPLSDFFSLSHSPEHSSVVIMPITLIHSLSFPLRG